jgi:hypothetical protein
VILGGVFSLTVAIVSGFIAYYAAQPTSQNSLGAVDLTIA